MIVRGVWLAMQQTTIIWCVECECCRISESLAVRRPFTACALLYLGNIMYAVEGLQHRVFCMILLEYIYIYKCSQG
jgi:hypothetical protein